MKLRKAIVLLVISALLLGTIGFAVAQDEDALIIWADATRAPILEALGEQFTADTTIPVVVQELAFGDIRDQFKTAAIAGEGPDIIIGAHDWLGELVVNGSLAEIDLSDVEDQFLPAAIDAFKYDGVQYGMPYATENVAFVRNPDLVPDAPATWDEVKAISEKLVADGDSQYGYIIQDGDPYHFFPILTAFGGYVFGVTDEGYNPEDVGIDSEGGLASAEWLQSMVAEELLPTGVDYGVMHSLFESGDAAMIITGPWAINEITESGVPFEVSNIPAGPAGDARPFLGVQGFMISSFSDKQLLAESFLLDYVATADAMQSIYDSDPRSPAFLEVRDSIDDPILNGFITAGTDGLAMPAIPEMSSVWEAWTNALTLIRNSQLDADEAFTDAAGQIRTFIEEGSESTSG